MRLGKAFADATAASGDVFRGPPRRCRASTVEMPKFNHILRPGSAGGGELPHSSCCQKKMLILHGFTVIFSVSA